MAAAAVMQRLRTVGRSPARQALRADPLGVMMYRMNSGQLPFRAEGQGEVMAMHIFSTAKPLRDHDPSIPEGMADLVARMMSKAPADRPTMHEVTQELDKMSGLASSASQPVPILASGATAEHSGVSSTLSAALGQSGSMKVVTETPPRRSRALLGVLATAGLLLCGLGVRLGVMHLRAASGSGGIVVWVFNSNPPHAQVLRKQDGKELCVTPCSQEAEPGTGRVSVVFRAPNYDDEEVTLEETQPFSRQVTLRPGNHLLLPPSPPPSETSPEATKPGAGAVAAVAGANPGTAPAGGDVTAPSPHSPSTDVGAAKTPDNQAGAKTLPPHGAPDSNAPNAPNGPGAPTARQPNGKLPAWPTAKHPVAGKANDSMLTDDQVKIIE
jgi:hypothetical protein